MARKSKVLSKSKAPKDFSKVKNKVGKKKQEKANEMKTDFKVKKVQMPAQNALEEKGEEVTHRKLGLGELLAHLQHHSAKVRRDALKGLLELCRDHPGVLNVNLSQILDSISLAASDGSADVRSAQRSLQAFILDQMPPAALSAFGATLALQVRGAISHVSGEVREDGLKLLELYLSRLGSKQVLTQGEAGRLVSTLCQLHSHVELVLPCLLQLLSTQTGAADEDGEVAQLSLQDVLEGKLKKVTSVSRDSEADNEIWDFCLRAWMQAGDMPRGDAKGSGAKAGWMRLRVAAVLEQALIEVLAGSGDSRPSASQVATLSGIVRRQEWPIHVDAGSPLRPLADSINLRMARMLALLVTGAASQDAAPKHLQRLAHASLAVLDTVLLPAVAALAAHVRQLSVAAAAAAAAQALEVVAKGSDEATEVKPFTSIGCLCHGLLLLELLWSQTEHFSTTDLQHLAGVTAAVAAGTGRTDDEFLPTTAALLAVPLTASLLDLHCDPVPPLLQRAVPRRCARQTSRDTARVIEELRPGTLMSWVTSWPKLLWYLGSSHPKLTLFLMTTILKLGKAAEAGSLHEKLLSGLLPLLVPFIAGMPGDQSAPPLAKLTEEDGLQAMAAAMLFHFPRLRASLIQLLGNALCRWSVATNGDAGYGDTCCELILEAMLHGQSSESDEEVLIARLRASLAVLQSCPATDDAERSSLKLANVIAAWVVEQLGATYPTKNRLIGLRLDQRRHLALQHVAWPLCRDLLGAKMSSSVMARRAFCFFYLCARRLTGTGTGTGTDAVDDDADADISGRVAFLREVFDSLVLSDALQPSPVFQSLLREKSAEARGASLFVQAWMAAATPHRSAAYELLLRLCAARLDVESAAWVLVEAVMYRNAHGLNTDSWGLAPLGFDGPAPSPSALRQQLTSTSTSSTSGAAREQILALLPLL